MRITPRDYCERERCGDMLDDRRLWMEDCGESHFFFGENGRRIALVEGEVFARFFNLLQHQESGTIHPDFFDAYHCFSTVCYCFDTPYHVPSAGEMLTQSFQQAQVAIEMPFGVQWRDGYGAQHAQIVAVRDVQPSDALLLEKTSNVGPYYISGFNFRSERYQRLGHRPHFYEVLSS